MSLPKPPQTGNLTALLDDLARQEASGPAKPWGEALVPGVMVGRFSLKRELYRDDSLVAFAAHDTILDRPVALKLLRAGPARIEADRLHHEAETIAGLSHPNLVALFDAGRCEHGPYLVFELLRGESLKERLARGPLEPREALRIGHEVARGLAHAHASGVAHRDLRARNVFLCEDGSVKVLDLGVAHAFGQVRRDGPGPEYVAPEQWRGAPEDERTDLYALGVLLYQMLSGQFPFPGDSGGRVASGPEPAPALDVAGLPRLGELVGQLLAKDPVDRPRDGAAAAALLGALRGDESRSTSISLSTTGSRSRSGSAVRVRRGYRWLRSPAFWIALLAVVVSAVALSAWYQGRRVTLGDATPSIAVIPFSDLSPGQDQEYFSDGLSEEILNSLSQVDGLRVAGRTSARAFKGHALDLRAIGRQLGVAAVLEGSVRKDGRRVRVTAQLVKTADGIRLWTQTFERELTGVFEVQDEIASAVVAALEVELLSGRTPSSRQYRTANPEVYNLFLQGRRFLRRDTSAGARLAAAAYQRAIDLAPGYAPAWAGLSFAQFWGWANVADTEKNLAAAKDRARSAADKAVALAPDLADGYAARGFFRINLDRDFAGASADMEKARALAPGDPDIMWRYARSLLGPMGRVEEAIALARRAAQLDPRPRPP